MKQFLKRNHTSTLRSSFSFQFTFICHPLTGLLGNNNDVTLTKFLFTKEETGLVDKILK